MRGIVGVLKRNSVEGHGVLAIFNTPEKRFALAEPHAVAVDTEGAGRHLDRLVEIGKRRREVLQELRGDLGSGRSRVKRVAGRRELRRERSDSFNVDRLGLGSEAQGDGEIRRDSAGDLQSGAIRLSKAGRGYFDCIDARRKPVEFETTLVIHGDELGHGGSIVLYGRGHPGDGRSRLI
jgi:hypothetical protein